jgi:LysM repeat protein
MKRLWIAAPLAAGLLFAGAHTVSAGQAHRVPSVVYQVKPGDTLWTIAGRIAGPRDRRELVDELISSNHLTSPVIFAGQHLALPRG